MTDPCMGKKQNWFVFVDGQWQTINMAYIRIRHGIWMRIPDVTGPYEVTGKLPRGTTQRVGEKVTNIEPSLNPDAPCMEYLPTFGSFLG